MTHRNSGGNACDLSRVVRIVVLEMHRLLVAQQVGEMRPGIHPIIDIENFLPSAFLVLSELPIVRYEIENRQSKSPVETYDTLVVVKTVWGLNVEDVALHIALILRHPALLKSHERGHNLHRPQRQTFCAAD